MKRLVPVLLVAAVACTSAKTPVASNSTGASNSQSPASTASASPTPSGSATHGFVPSTKPAATPKRTVNPAASTAPSDTPPPSGSGGSTMRLSGTVVGTLRTSAVTCTTKTVHVAGTVGTRRVDISWSRSTGIVSLNFQPTTAHSNGFIGRGGARIDTKTVTIDQRFDGENAKGAKSGETETAKGSVTCTSGSSTTASK